MPVIIFILTLLVFSPLAIAGEAAQPEHFKAAGKPQKAGTAKSVPPVRVAPLGATVESVLAAGRGLTPALRAAALDTAAAAAKAAGADALEDPTISDSYHFYRNPNVFSGHAIMVTQAFPLWGKQSLRREAALADLDAMRGREQAARNALDERIKVAFAAGPVVCSTGSAPPPIGRWPIVCPNISLHHRG